MWESRLETMIALGKHCSGQPEYENLLSSLIADFGSTNETISEMAFKRLNQWIELYNAGIFNECKNIIYIQIRQFQSECGKLENDKFIQLSKRLKDEDDIIQEWMLSGFTNGKGVFYIKEKISTDEQIIWSSDVEKLLVGILTKNFSESLNTFILDNTVLDYWVELYEIFSKNEPEIFTRFIKQIISTHRRYNQTRKKLPSLVLINMSRILVRLGLTNWKYDRKPIFNQFEWNIKQKYYVPFFKESQTGGNVPITESVLNDDDIFEGPQPSFENTNIINCPEEVIIESDSNEVNDEITLSDNASSSDSDDEQPSDSDDEQLSSNSSNDEQSSGSEDDGNTSSSEDEEMEDTNIVEEETNDGNIFSISGHDIQYIFNLLGKWSFDINDKTDVSKECNKTSWLQMTWEILYIVYPMYYSKMLKFINFSASIISNSSMEFLPVSIKEHLEYIFTDYELIDWFKMWFLEIDKQDENNQEETKFKSVSSQIPSSVVDVYSVWCSFITKYNLWDNHGGESTFYDIYEQLFNSSKIKNPYMELDMIYSSLTISIDCINREINNTNMKFVHRSKSSIDITLELTMKWLDSLQKLKLEDTEEFYHTIIIYYKMILEMNNNIRQKWLQYCIENKDYTNKFLMFILKYVQYEGITFKSLKNSVYVMFVMFMKIPQICKDTNTNDTIIKYVTNMFVKSPCLFIFELEKVQAFFKEWKTPIANIMSLHHSPEDCTNSLEKWFSKNYITNQLRNDFENLFLKERFINELELDTICYDPITNCIMNEPVKLPHSGQIVNHSTIKQHLLSSDCDPFTRNKMSLKDVIIMKDLQKTIEEKIKIGVIEKKKDLIREKNVKEILGEICEMIVMQNEE